MTDQRVAARRGAAFNTVTGDDGYAERAEPAPFGYQLLLDLYGCNEKTLCDINRVYAFLEMLVGELGMTKQAPPFVFLSPPEFLDKQGISGWVPLIESGIQIHTLVQKRFVSVDVYCCRKFNADTVRTIAKTVFEANVIDMTEVHRGRKYRYY